jgi:hypothetical protein
MATVTTTVVSQLQSIVFVAYSLNMSADYRQNEGIYPNTYP